MKEAEKDIPLTKEEIQKIKEILEKTKFEDFKINHHYWVEGIYGLPRHGVQLQQLKNIFNKTELITRAFKRKSETEFSYTLCYKLTAMRFIKVCFFFDKKPIEIFNAMLINRNLNRSVLERYGINLTNN